MTTVLRQISHSLLKVPELKSITCITSVISICVIIEGENYVLQKNTYAYKLINKNIAIFIRIL